MGKPLGAGYKGNSILTAQQEVPIVKENWYITYPLSGQTSNLELKKANVKTMS